ncbi:pyridoxal-phosphate dependent enzyme [Alphaproteobacteria bacterium]|nr:pyridoxal-phosphate dependent enzyme [Alphaproteobacteria bacterium]
MPQKWEKPLHQKTPLIQSFSMGRHFNGRPVYLKMEAFQPTGSFKIRGLGYACQQALQRGARQFLSSTEGNAGYAVSYAGRQLGVPTTVVMAENIPPVMREKIHDMGAHVILYGKEWEEAHHHALQLQQEHNLKNPENMMAYIPPFDLEDIWQGHMSLVDEWDEAPEAVIVAVGGGGLLMGILRGLIKRGWGHVPVYSAETRGSEALALSLKTGQHVHLKDVNSIAHSIALKSVCARAFEEAHAYGVRPLVVTDNAAVAATLSFAQDHNVIVEPACGAALAPIYGNDHALKNVKSVHVVVCGGLGTTFEDLQAWSGA